MNEKLGKNIAIGGGLTAAGLIAASSAPIAAANTYNLAVGSAVGVFEGTKSLVGNVLNVDGGATAAALAPFAMPMVGALGGWKIADAMEIENKALKLAAKAGGAVSGAAVGAWAIPYMPAVIGGGLLLGGAYLGYKGLKWTGRKVGFSSASA